MERHRNPSVNGVFDADCLELGEDPVPGQIVTNNLQRIGSKPITYNNTYPPINWALLLQRQLNYVEDIIVTRYTENLGMSTREVIQTIS